MGGVRRAEVILAESAARGKQRCRLWPVNSLEYLHICVQPLFSAAWRGPRRIRMGQGDCLPLGAGSWQGALQLRRTRSGVSGRALA